MTPQYIAVMPQASLIGVQPGKGNGGVRTCYTCKRCTTVASKGLPWVLSRLLPCSQGSCKASLAVGLASCCLQPTFVHNDSTTEYIYMAVGVNSAHIHVELDVCELILILNAHARREMQCREYSMARQSCVLRQKLHGVNGCHRTTFNI